MVSWLENSSSEFWADKCWPPNTSGLAGHTVREATSCRGISRLLKPAVASSATIRADLQDAQDETFRDSTPVGSGKAAAATTGTPLPGVQNFHENALL